ncbi:hypothetical protein [Mesorhizobium sp. M0152]|uniref:hypothetical protein n=1 Tax=unclassified Mesorhizobium TaxID=325217 RepID=UPI003339E051
MPLKSAQKEENYSSKVSSEAFENADHFIEKGGMLCVGSHLIIDLFEAERLDELDHIAQTLIDCVEAAGATLLHLHLHPFNRMGA